MCVCSARSDWFMNGNYLIIIVTVCIILPLALMKHLGMSTSPQQLITHVFPHCLVSQFDTDVDVKHWS